MITTIAAGNSENKDHTIERTESVIDVGSTIEFPVESVIILAPAKPKNKATNEPEIAVPNFVPSYLMKILTL